MNYLRVENRQADVGADDLERTRSHAVDSPADVGPRPDAGFGDGEPVPP